MDDYHDVKERYTRRLEQIITENGLTLPDAWGVGGGEQVHAVAGRPSVAPEYDVVTDENGVAHRVPRPVRFEPWS
jgi:hypothetical protein